MRFASYFYRNTEKRKITNKLLGVAMGIKFLTEDERKAMFRELLAELSVEDIEDALLDDDIDEAWPDPGSRIAGLEREESRSLPRVSKTEADIQAKLAKLRAKGSSGSNPEGAEVSSSQPGTLAPLRHQQLDFFVADIMDAAPKDDGASMEHPVFALKAGDKRVREYERNGVKVQVFPGHNGCATVFDKDIWIYCISQLVEAMNRGRQDMSRTVRFTAYDFLVASNRGVDGRSYERLGDAMNRLAGTRIETNIETSDERERAGFGLIDSWRVVERAADHRMVAVEVTLPQWLWRSITSKNVLTISKDYFRIRKPINRRLYELARKHCGKQKIWKASMAVLFQKSGSSDTLAKFRAAVKTLAEANDLPDDSVEFNQKEDMVIFKRRARPKGDQEVSVAGLLKDSGIF